MGKLIMLIGIPGCGKSTYAKKLKDEIRGSEIVSTDEIRRDLFGEDSAQKDTYKVFDKAHGRIVKYLNEGRCVIYDATNINKDKRMKLIKKLDCEIEAHVVLCSIEECITRCKDRKRKIDAHIVMKYATNFEFPFYKEGINNIRIECTSTSELPYGESFIRGLCDTRSKEEFQSMIKGSKELARMVDFDQGSIHHKHTLDVHTHKVCEYIVENATPEWRDVLYMAGIYHDVGKVYTKRWKEEKGTHTYYGHENVSTYIASMELSNMKKDRLLDILGIISMHMRMQYDTEGAANFAYHMFGERLLVPLYEFQMADSLAK